MVTEPARNLTRRSIDGMFWTALFMGVFAVSELVALIVLARLLSPSDFGLYIATLIVVQFSLLFAGFGIAQAIVQRLNLEDLHLRTGFTLSILLSLAAAAVVWASADAIEAAMQLPGLGEVLRGGAWLAVLFQGFAMVPQAAAQRALRFRWLAGMDALAFSTGYLLIGPVLALLGFGIWALVGALVSQQFIRMVILFSGQSHPKRPSLSPRAAGQLLYFGGGLTISRVFDFLARQIDKVIVGRWLGVQPLGLYTLASQFMTTPTVILGEVLDRVLFPTMSLVQNDPVRLARAYRSAIAACTLVILPGSAVVIVIAPELVHVLLGPAWAGVALPLRILALGMVFRSSYKLGDSVARATGAVYARAWRQAVFAGAVAVGCLIGQNWGIGGVAFGVVGAVFVNYMLMAHLSLRRTSMRWAELAAAHRPGAALAAVVGATAWALAVQLRALDHSALSLVAEVVLLALGEAILLCWLMPAIFLGPDARSIFGTIGKMIPDRLDWFSARSRAPD